MILLPLAFTLSLTVAADDPPMSVLKGLEYPVARSRLLADGYRPRKVEHQPNSLTCFEGFCDRFPEAIHCSAAGIHYCRFIFDRSGRDAPIIVVTRGETRYEVLEVREARQDDLDEIRWQATGSPFAD